MIEIYHRRANRAAGFWFASLFATPFTLGEKDEKIKYFNRHAFSNECFIKLNQRFLN